MAYNGSVELAAGIKPKNNGSFPMVNAKDVYVDDHGNDTRLNVKLSALEAAIGSIVPEINTTDDGYGNVTIGTGNAYNMYNYRVQYTLLNCSSSNTSAIVAKDTHYYATITANDGYTLDAVTVYIDGTDVTSTYYNSTTGQIHIPNGNVDQLLAITASATSNHTITVNHSVTSTLSNCVSSNAATSVENQTSYTTTITANSGYTLGTVTVTMGGTDITSTAYNSSTGVVSIASVTGSVIITASASAVQSGPSNNILNPATESLNWTRAVGEGKYLKVDADRIGGLGDNASYSYVGTYNISGLHLSGATVVFNARIRTLALSKVLPDSSYKTSTGNAIGILLSSSSTPAVGAAIEFPTFDESEYIYLSITVMNAKDILDMFDGNQPLYMSTKVPYSASDVDAYHA